MSAASRRGLLGSVFAGAAVAALPPVASAASGADAELIRLCAEIDALERRMDSYHEGGSHYIADEAELYDAIKPLSDEQEELIDRICRLPTRTAEGFRARLRTMALWSQDWVEGLADAAAAGDGFWHERMQAAFFRDMLAGDVA